MGAAINLATLAYTESDPNSRITISTVTCTGVGLKRDESAKVYYDWGAGYFGDFVHDFDLTETTLANGSKLIIWGLSNTADSKDQWAAGIYLQIDATGTSNHTFTLGEIGGSTSAGATTTKATKYFRVERNGTTLTAKFATSAANRTAGTWVETITLSVADTTYRYHYAMSTINEANTTAISVATANWKGTKMTSAGTPFDTAYMVGASAGNWDSGATWGNAGSSRGTDYPGTAADAFNIDVDDTVTYNVSEANALGASAIYGTLTFKPDANTLLTMAHAILSIRAGGALRIGTAASPIQAANTAKLEFVSTGDNSIGLYNYAGGTVEIEGTDLNGGVMMAVLAANWTAGQTLTVVGDVHTAAWVAGQKFVIHLFPATYATALNTYEYTINSMSANGADTDITITEAAPGYAFRAGAVICNTTRNVTIGKYGATLTVGSQNTQRPYFRNYSTSLATAAMSIKHATMNGMYGAGGYTTTPGGRTDFENVVIRNGNALGAESYWGFRCQVNKVVIIGGLFQRFASSRITNVVCYMCGGFGYFVDCEFSDCYFVNVFSASGVLPSALVMRTKFNRCDFVDIRAGMGSAASTYLGEYTKFYNCNFGKFRHHANVCTVNNFFYSVPDRTIFQFYNCVVPTDPPVFTTWSASGGNTQPDGIEITFDDFNGTVGDFRRYTRYFWTKSNSTTVRGGGAAASIEVSNLDYMDRKALGQPIFEWIEWDVPASAQSRAVYIRGGTGGGEDWSTYPTAEELFLEAEYFDEAGTARKAFAVSSAVLTDNTTWTAFSVSFTPGAVGAVVYRLRFGIEAGIASKKIYVDPQLNS